MPAHLKTSGLGAALAVPVAHTHRGQPWLGCHSPTSNKVIFLSPDFDSLYFHLEGGAMENCPLRAPAHQQLHWDKLPSLQRTHNCAEERV